MRVGEDEHNSLLADRAELVNLKRECVDRENLIVQVDKQMDELTDLLAKGLVVSGHLSARIAELQE